MTGRLLEPTSEKDCPLNLSWAIWTGAEPLFKSETVVLAVWPIGTCPNVTVLGDAMSVPVLAPLAIMLPPQPVMPKGIQKDKMMSGIVHQPNRQLVVCERLLQDDAFFLTYPGLDWAGTRAPCTAPPLRTL